MNFAVRSIENRGCVICLFLTPNMDMDFEYAKELKYCRALATRPMLQRILSCRDSIHSASSCSQLLLIEDPINAGASQFDTQTPVIDLRW